MTTPVLAALLTLPVIAGAILVIAVIVIIGVLFILRSGRKKDATGASSMSDWRRQGQDGGWNPQGANANNWQQGQVQQAGGWNSSPNPQQNNWGAPNQQPSGNAWNSSPNQQQNNWSMPNQQQPSGNSWNGSPNSPQPQPVNAWDNNANMAQQQQQPMNAWNSSNPAQQQQQPMNAWDSSNPAQQQQPMNAWNQQNQQPAQNAWAPAPSTGQDQWGQQNAASAPSWGQQGASSSNQQPAPNSFSGNPNQGWNNPQQPAGYQQAGYPQQGNPASIPPWQQNNYNPNSMGDPTVMAENDRTVLRAPGSTGAPGSLGYVRVEEGKEPGRIYEVRKESLSIGRSRASDIFLADLAVSRLHASIVNMGNGNYALKDEGSANGTKVNGQVVNKFQTYPLQEGDQIQLGQTVLVFGRK